VTSEKGMFLFTDKTLMITERTGFLDNAILNRFLFIDIGAIRIFSHDDMRHEYQAKMPKEAHKIKFFISNVWDL